MINFWGGRKKKTFHKNGQNSGIGTSDVTQQLDFQKF
jgi:hypothetical protein